MADAENVDGNTELDEKKVYYDGGWKPKQTKIKQEDPDAPPTHKKIAEYQVIVNNDTQYSWNITTHVTHPYDVEKVSFHEEAADCDVRIEEGGILDGPTGRLLVITKKGEQWGIAMKLPKSVDLDATPFTACDRHTLLLTMPKIGATEPVKGITMEDLKPDWAVDPKTINPPIKD